MSAGLTGIFLPGATFGAWPDCINQQPSPGHNRAGGLQFPVNSALGPVPDWRWTGRFGVARLAGHRGWHLSGNFAADEISQRAYRCKG